MRRPASSLFWRLLVSYLLVIAVSCLGMYGASEVLSTLFLDAHLRRMAMPAGMPMSAMLERDLERAHSQAMRQAALWGALISLVVAGALSLWVSARIAHPVRLMQRVSRRIAAGQYQERLDVRAPSEISDLAQAFNDMAAALETTEARRVELLGNVAHEFRTPLSSLHGYLEGLSDGVFQNDAVTLTACQRQLERLERLVEDLSLLSRVETGQEPVTPQPTPVRDLLEAVVSTFMPAFAHKGVRLRPAPVPAPLAVLADPERTQQVLGNLVANALRHTPPGGEVQLSVSPLNPKELMICVSDTGEGIAPEALPHIFSRFYRADPSRSREAGEGSGIGLTIAKYFVEAQGGRIEVSSTLGNGSRFRVILLRA